MKKSAVYLGLGVVICLLLLSLLFLPSFERKAPEVILPEEGVALGARAEVPLRLSDRPSGLKGVRVSLVQGGKAWEVYQEDFPEGTYEKDLTVVLEPRRLGLEEGEALFLVQAADRSLWNFGRGNRTTKTLRVRIDLTPPVLELLSVTRYIYSNGSGAVLFRASPDTAEAGVRVGGCFFKAYPGKGGLWYGLFGIPLYAGSTQGILVARDKAGNEAQIALSYVVLPRKVRKKSLSLSEAFIQGKVYPLLPPERRTLPPEEAFRFVNETMRAQDEEAIKEIASRSSPLPYWQGAFLQLPNSKVMATFGDRRTYLYQDKPVGHSVHLALDLASTANAPVPAANHGVVIYTGTIGIYGNVVIIDHGLGLATLYAHLSRWTVREGQRVKKGEIIGYTGETGFAGGDHLHFAVMLSGYPVDPVDWLDPKWIGERIQSVLALEG